jgi:hypothetical protein
MVVYWKTTFGQQGFLMRRRVLEACDYLDEQRHFARDAEYWLRLLLAGRTFRHVPQSPGQIRLHEATKTSTTHAVHVSDLVDITTTFCRTAPPERQELGRFAHRNAFIGTRRTPNTTDARTPRRAARVRRAVDDPDHPPWVCSREPGRPFPG